MKTKRLRLLVCAMFFVATPCFGAVTHVQQASNSVPTKQYRTSFTVAFNANTTVGNAIVVSLTWGSTNTTITATDSQGNTFQEAIQEYDSVNPDLQGAAIFYATNIKGGADTITINFADQVAWVTAAVHEYSGLANALDVSVGALGSGTSPSSSSVATTANGDLIFGAVVEDINGTADTYTPGSGFTKRVDLGSTAGFADEDRIQPSAGSTAATWTLSPSGLKWVAVMAAFKASNGTEPRISSVSPSQGGTGTSITMAGSNFGATQGSSTVEFSGMKATPTSWSSTSIVAPVPPGALSGNLVVAISGTPSNPIYFTALPAGWSDADVGDVGVTGGAGYSNGTFIVQGAGPGAWNYEDGLHFAYQSLSGDGAIVARVVGWDGGTTVASACVMIRETLHNTSKSVCTESQKQNVNFNYRNTGNTSQATGGAGPLPYWLKAVRTGTTFSGYKSADGVNWVQIGSSQTITMAQSVLIGLTAASGNTSSLTTVTFDNASISMGTITTPSITSLSPTSGSIGTSVTITGANFGATRGTSTVTFNGTAATPTSWSTTSIVVPVPSGGTTGNVMVTVGGVPSNAMGFTVLGSQSITGVSPTSGTVGTSVTVTGTNFGATQGTSSVLFNGGTATSITSWSNTQIIATVPSSGSTGPVVVVINSISSNSNFTFTFVGPVLSNLQPPNAQASSNITLNGAGFGASQGGSTVSFNGAGGIVGAWSDASITVSVPGNATSGPVTVTVNGITSNSQQFTVLEALSVTSFSPAVGPVGSTLTINGAGFGAVQSNSVASLFGTPAIVTSWSDTQIVATVPPGATSGPISVQVATTTAYSSSFFTLSRTVQSSDSLGNSTAYTAQMVGGRWVVTDSQGSGCSTCTVRGNIHNTYDGSGNLLSRTDELGRITSYTYDANNNVTSVVQPAVGGVNPTTNYTYNGFGEVLTVTDPLGNVTTNTYDSQGNLLTVTSPKPNSTAAASLSQFAYDSKGELTQITDPLSNLTGLTYSPAGLVATIKDAQLNVTTYGYDSHGNRTSVTDALTHQTAFAYDPGDRLKTITYSDTTTTGFVYDSRGRRTSVTDQNGKVTSYSYDDADRLLTVTDPSNSVTTYGYDTEDNLISIKDANLHTTSFGYDPFGRVTKTTFPSGFVETYTYDAVGNLTGKTDRKNQLIAYTFDQLNRLTQKSFPDTKTVNYTYDLDSRLTQVTDSTGTYQLTFDNMGRLTAASTSYAFLTARNFTTGYSYDAASNRTGFTDPESGSTTYAYDTLNRLQTLTPPSAFSGTASFGFSYDALSRRTQMTRPNNVATNYAYDNLSRLQRVLHQLAGNTIDGATYTVDNAGNRTAKTDQRAAVTSNYGYDAIYELMGVTQGTNTTESYTYDPIGNRLSSLGVSPYSVNVSNELTSTPSTSYTYDYNGNLLTKVVGSNTTSYSWDFENRLTSVTLPGSGGTVTFRYDPFGRRIYKSSSSGTSIFAYDGNNLVEETNSSGGVVARYTQTQRVDEPLAMLRSGATNYYEQDGVGSVTSLSTGAGALAQTYTFDSFGNQTAASGSLTNAFRYTGREFDTETNLYYYRARYYDQTAGRFLSEDPLGTALRHNKYRYVSNSPTVLKDAYGLQEQCSFNETQQISPWIFSIKRSPLSGWRFLTSFAEDPDEEVGIPAALVTCEFERTISKETWKSALFLLSWNCEETGPCGVTHKRIKYSLRKQTEFVGLTQDTEQNFTQFWTFGATDEVYDFLCVTKHTPSP
jgi:RHS repeat-associated protein